MILCIPRRRTALVGFKIKSVEKLETELEVGGEDILRYFEIKELSFEMKHFYHYDKPKGLRIITTKKFYN